MIVIGITGSIGMGKSTVADMLRQEGIPVHESDAEVHHLLSRDETAKLAVGAAFPYFEHPQIYKGKNKDIDRAALGEIVFSNDSKRETLEGILHPLVRLGQQKFLREAQKTNAKIAALDIPLLFETGGDQFVDITLVASAPYFVQRERVLARPGMTEEKFHAILQRQMPDAEKCARADFVVHTGLSRAETMKEIKKILVEIRSK
jgi:dephospho-CoA kinase